MSRARPCAFRTKRSGKGPSENERRAAVAAPGRPRFRCGVFVFGRRSIDRSHLGKGNLLPDSRMCHLEFEGYKIHTWGQQSGEVTLRIK